MTEERRFDLGDVTVTIDVVTWESEASYYSGQVLILAYGKGIVSDALHMSYNFKSAQAAERFYRNFRDIDALAFINISNQIGSDEPRNTVTKLAC
jgi:hypothetical protein